MHELKRIISGGQTGADRAALDFAIENGIESGGFVPLGRKAEDGKIPAKYPNLIEAESEDAAVRTELNVANSDATIAISHGELAGGSLLTKQFAEIHKKPFIHIDLSANLTNDAVEKAKRFLASCDCAIVNIAGPRLSEDPRIYTAVKNFLEHLFRVQR